MPARPPSRARRLLCAALLGLMAFGNAAASEPISEDAVKAAFLFRFTGYVDWPAEALAGAQFNIAVLGADGVTGHLERLLAQHPVKQLPARALAIKDVAELRDVQVLYVGARWQGDLAALAESLADRPILLVVDRGDGLDSGATMNFVVVDRRVRFEVSMPAAARAGLRVGPALLSVAARVRGLPRSEARCDSAGTLPDSAPPACAAMVALQ